MMEEVEFRAYLWAYWCVAAKARRGRRNALAKRQQRDHEQELASATSAGEVKARRRTRLDPEEGAAYDAMVGLCTSPGLNGNDVPAGVDAFSYMPERRPDAVLGFSRAAQALWVRPHRAGANTALSRSDELEKLLGREQLELGTFDKVFSRGGTVYETLVDFLDMPQFSAIARGGGIQRVSLNAIQRGVFERITGHAVPETIPFAGVFLFAKEVGVYWIALRSYEEVKTIAHGQAGLSDDLLLPVVRQALDRVRSFPLVSASSWWEEIHAHESLVTLAKQDQGRWRLLVAELLREPRIIDVLAERGCAVEDVIVLGEVATGQDLEALVRDVLGPHLATLGTLTLVVNRSAEDAIGIVKRALPWRSGLHVEVIGLEHIEAWVCCCPWLWAKYFVDHQEYCVVRNDDAMLARLLLRDDDARTVMASSAAWHPGLREVRLSPGSRLCLYGAPGTGRSTALFQLLRRDCIGAVLFCISPRCTMESWTVLSRIIEEVLGRQTDPVVLVMDDVDQAVGTSSGVFGGVLDFGDRSGPALSVVLSVVASQRSRVEETFEFKRRYLMKGLDGLSDEFLLGVAGAYASVLASSAPERMLRIFVRRAMADRAPLLALVAGLLAGRGEPLGMVGFRVLRSATEDRGWALAYESLLHAGVDDAVKLLQLLGVLSWCGVEEVPESSLAAYCRVFLGLSLPGQFETAWSRLVGAGWFMVLPDGMVVLDGARFGRALADVAPRECYGECSLYVREFLVWTATHSNCLDAAVAGVVLTHGAAVLGWSLWPVESLVVLRAVLSRGSLEEYDLARFLRWHKVRRNPSGCMDDLAVIVAAVKDRVRFLRMVGEYLLFGSWLFEIDYPWLEAWPVFVEFLCGRSSVVRVGDVLRVLEYLGRRYPHSRGMLGLAVVMLERERELDAGGVARLARLREEWRRARTADRIDAGCRRG